MNKKSLPGWTINIDEISNGVFKVILMDNYGRKTETIDIASEETIEKAIGYAFDIEKQISQNWNIFLYDLAVQKLLNKDFQYKEFNEIEFGSWFIERQDKRLVYDGKDSLLIFQKISKDIWTDIDTIKKDELMYSNFVTQINRLTENTTHNSTLPKTGPS